MAQKKFRLEILEPAQRELEEIAHMHLELVGSSSARNIVSRIYGALEKLQSHPRMGVMFEDKDLRLKGFRKLTCENYLCFCRAIGETIFVYHIADGRIDYKRLFRGFASVPE